MYEDIYWERNNEASRIYAIDSSFPKIGIYLLQIIKLIKKLLPSRLQCKRVSTGFKIQEVVEARLVIPVPQKSVYIFEKALSL